jgi:hypothetical protein
MFDEVLAELRGAVGRLAHEDVGLLDDAEFARQLVELRREVDRLDAEWQRRFGVFERRAAWKEGARTAAAWLRRFCRIAGGQARQRVLAARRLPQLDATSEAYASGAISFAHVATITRSVTDVRAEHVDEADAVFARAARDLEPRDLQKVVALWREAVDPEASIKEDKGAEARRKAWIAPVGDGVAMEGFFGKVGGEALLTAVSALVAAARRQYDTRTRGQRNAGAVVALAEAALRAGTTPAVGGERPHSTVTMSLETLEGRLGAPPARLQWGGEISGLVARMLACDARITRIITDAPSIPLDVARAQRTVPAWLRRALAARDQGCRMPDCDRPPGWCVAHHIVFWADGGPTELWNLVLMCPEHHTDVHVHGWQITLHADGSVTATSPDGHTYTEEAPATQQQRLEALVAGEHRATYRPQPTRPPRPQPARTARRRRTAGNPARAGPA